jgi:hypothetical protein
MRFQSLIAIPPTFKRKPVLVGIGNVCELGQGWTAIDHAQPSSGNFTFVQPTKSLSWMSETSWLGNGRPAVQYTRWPDQFRSSVPSHKFAIVDSH